MDFPVGAAGRRELRRALLDSRYPEETIRSHQQSNSLHTMLARALGTRPQNSKDDDDNTKETEPLDTDSVSTFLFHLGIPRHEIHRRIADSLKSHLEDEIRKQKDDAPLLHLLKSCWPYATATTSVPELRQVLWAVLKHLGSRTPLAVLERLAERDDATGKLKHEEIWQPLTPLLKRLVWEADWDRRQASGEMESSSSSSDPDKFLAVAKKTLLGELVIPLIDEYCSDEALVAAANKAFVGSSRERRLATPQRRTRGGTSSSVAASNSTTSLVKPLQLSTTTKSSSANITTTTTAPSHSKSGEALSSLRRILGGTGDTTTTSSSSSSPLSYRPKLFCAVLSIIMARHGQSKMRLLGGSSHLHCTLVTDLLLSSGGPLPKPYQHLLALARVLDDKVNTGEVTDAAIAATQTHVRNIFQDDTTTTEASSSESAAASKSTESKASFAPVDSDRQVLQRIIKAALSAMKEADPQSLFLNPVTDEVAPGYSTVIEKPMCIKVMEEKVRGKSRYNTLAEWDRDVQLMFRNCIAYNTGNGGQWFRGEARRQNKIFKDNILSQAKALLQKEMSSKRQQIDASSTPKKRKVGAVASSEENTSLLDIAPLPESKSKRRKKDSQGDVPSIPALASMVLTDPFVVRLFLDRILRLLRLDVMRGTAIPSLHRVIPSLLQLLHVAQYSGQICAIRGKRYFVPDAGLVFPQEEKKDALGGGGAGIVPFASLRRCTPLVVQLLVESELDKRMALGGDLSLAAKKLPNRTSLIRYDFLTNNNNNSHLYAARALLEGALVHVCRPGNSHESSLAITFPKFATALNHLSQNLWDEKPFFVSLIESLIRHKSKLSRSTRDVVLAAWFEWFKVGGDDGADKAKGAMSSALHECLLSLLNEWAALGNLVLPRDMLLKYAKDAVEAADATESSTRSFANLWMHSNGDNDDDGFALVKAQYLRMLQSIPDDHASAWKTSVGITDAKQ